MKNLFKIILFCLLLISVGCSSSDDTGGVVVGGPTNPNPTDPDPTDPDPTDPVDNGGPVAGGDQVIQGFTYDPSEILKDIVSFPMGNIVSAGKLASNSADNTTFKAILNEEYNSITAENDMKPNNMFLGPDDYDWSDGDAIVTYAQANGFRVHGHVLAWHSQQPGWFNSFAGTDEEFETAVMDYITATVAHFAEAKMPSGESVVSGWDVLNEAFENGNNSNPLYAKIPDLAAKCFTAARAGDPDVKLFYNDFNVAGDVDKRNSILNMVADLQSRSIPIDGIGMQMHLNHNWPNTDLPIAVQEIADTGLLVHVSELDVKANFGDDISELNTARAAEQEDQYQRAGFYYTTIVPAAQQYGLTLWGFRDQDSWLYDGGDDWPTLYDNDFNYKVTHRGLVSGLMGTNAP